MKQTGSILLESSPASGHRRWRRIRRAFYPPAWPVQRVEGTLRCPSCGYNLYTLSRIGRCPECGMFVESAFAFYVRRRLRSEETQQALRYGLILMLVFVLFVVLLTTAFEP